MTSLRIPRLRSFLPYSPRSSNSPCSLLAREDLGGYHRGCSTVRWSCPVTLLCHPLNSYPCAPGALKGGGFRCGGIYTRALAQAIRLPFRFMWTQVARWYALLRGAATLQWSWGSTSLCTVCGRAGLDISDDCDCFASDTRSGALMFSM